MATRQRVATGEISKEWKRADDMVSDNEIMGDKKEKDAAHHPTSSVFMARSDSREHLACSYGSAGCRFSFSYGSAG